MHQPEHSIWEFKSMSIIRLTTKLHNCHQYQWQGSRAYDLPVWLVLPRCSRMANLPWPTSASQHHSPALNGEQVLLKASTPLLWLLSHATHQRIPSQWAPCHWQASADFCVWVGKLSFRASSAAAAASTTADSSSMIFPVKLGPFHWEYNICLIQPSCLIQ